MRAGAVVAVLAGLAAAAGSGPEARAGGLIDFETLPGGAPTVDQQEIGLEYASLGVTFTLIDAAGVPIGTPNIAKVGNPETAFASCNGGDTPLPGQDVGQSFLTDNTTVGWSGNLLIEYASPVAQAAGVILDVDCRNCNAGGSCPGGCEQWTIEARDGTGAVIDTFVIDGPVGPPPPPCNDPNGPGDAAAFGWFFDHPTADIASVVVRYTGGATSVGLAFDNFTPSSIPALDAEGSASATRICRGQLVTLTGSASGGIPPYTFRWQVETAPGTWTDEGTGQVLDVCPAADAVYRLVVEDSIGNTVTGGPLPVTVTPVTFEVSQESLPGAGDFAANVLGAIVPYTSADTAVDYYGWTSGSTPFSGPDPPLTSDRSHLFLVKGADGLALYVVHDDGADASGGRAETRVDLLCETGAFVVSDDAGLDTFQTLNGGTRLQVRHDWASPRTDGYAIGMLECGWVAELSFSDVLSGDPTISGLDSWAAYSATGGPLALALEVDRRVRITALADECRSDVNASGAVDVTDLLAVLGLWGPCPPGPCPEDTDCDGQVAVGDLLDVLADWGPCP
ncbi:MAG: hypothetical protein ACYTG1_10710 [Planctomycetota bacterium]|jgi:hypothetical protein